jgi:Bacterial archaeo-eukaryotic release factor family 3
MARKYALPFALDERVVIDETFYTRNLVRALNRMRRYWVLALSEQPTRLFEATREHLEEVTTDGFPMLHTGHGGATRLPGGVGVNIARYRDDKHRQFFRAVDRALAPFLADDPLPLALVGVHRYQTFFREVSSNSGDIIATLDGNYDHVTAHDLGRTIWPLVSKGFTDRRLQVLERLAVAVGGQRSASTIGEVWRKAKLGMGQLLLVEDGYHQAARISEMGLLDLDVDDPGGPDVLDDAVDDVVSTVLAKGGQVVFVEDGNLAQHSRIALILRY